MDNESIESIDCQETGKDNPAFVIEETEYAGKSVKNIESINAYQEGEVNEEEERQKWSNPIEFLLSCISMSVSNLYCNSDVVLYVKYKYRLS